MFGFLKQFFAKKIDSFKPSLMGSFILKELKSENLKHWDITNDVSWKRHCVSFEHKTRKFILNYYCSIYSDDKYLEVLFLEKQLTDADKSAISRRIEEIMKELKILVKKSSPDNLKSLKRVCL